MPFHMGRKPPSIKEGGLEAIADYLENLGLPPTIDAGFRLDINQEINAYNSAESVPNRINTLIKIQKIIHDAELYLLSETPDEQSQFHDFKKKLFPLIKAAYAENGQASMAQEGGSLISSVLVNMEPEKADKLMELLQLRKGSILQYQSELLNLYDLDDKGHDARQWRLFLSEHSIEFLGGKNSLSFKVLNISDNDASVQVLKVDTRLGRHRNVEQHLRDKYGDIFMPIYAKRQVMGIVGKSNASRTLLVTDFCNQSDLLNYSINNTKDCLARPVIDSEICMQTSFIMGQMADTFKNIQDVQCIFPDAKLSNWLLDKGTVRLADTKSLMSTQNFNPLDMTFTPPFSPNELDYQNFSGEIKAEELHVFLLGLNIYSYLTASFPQNLDLDFSMPIFKTPLGSEYQTLILNLTKNPSSLRMPLVDAKNKLHELLWKSCPEVFHMTQALMNDGCPSNLFDFIMKLTFANPELPKENLVLDTIKKLQETWSKYKQLLTEMTENYTENIVRLMMDDTTSIADLTLRLDRFEKYPKKILEYLKIREDIEKLKISDSDQEMMLYLKECDQKILKMTKGPIELFNLDQLFSSMEEIKKGLEQDENKNVKDAITSFEGKKNWSHWNTLEKGQKIKQAMESIPITERAHLLSSKNESITQLFDALAWHRISSSLVVFGSARTFKEFKKKYNDKFKGGTEEENQKPKP